MNKAVGLRPGQYFTISIGTSIGVGWIPLYGSWLAEAGSIGLALAFLVGSAAMCFVAASYMRVASLYPVSGAETAYAYEIFGPRLGFFTGWILAFTYVATCIFEAIAVAMFANQLLPGVAGPPLYKVFGNIVGLGALLIGGGCAVLMGFIHYHGVAWAARFQDILTAILLGVCALFILFGVATGAPSQLNPYFSPPEAGWPLSGFLAVVAVSPLFCGGFNFAVQAIGERADDTSVKAVIRALFLAIICTGLFYVGLFIAAAMSLPREDLLAAEVPFAAAFSAVFGSPVFGKVIIFIALLGLLTSWNGVFLGLVLILSVLAGHGALPRWFTSTGGTGGASRGAVVFITGLTIAGMFGGVGMLGPIIGSASVTIASAYLIVGLCALRLQGRPVASGVSISRPTLLASVAVIAAIAATAITQPFFIRPEFHLPTPWIGLFAWLALGWAFYTQRRKQIVVGTTDVAG